MKITVCDIKEREPVKLSKHTEPLCQICEKFEVQWVLAGTYPGDVPYHICSNCLNRLVNLDLTKKQFKTVLKNGHTDDEYLLHGDYYNEQGKALQSMME